MPWYLYGLVQAWCANAAEAESAAAAAAAKNTAGAEAAESAADARADDDQAKQQVPAAKTGPARVGMLRLVNAHDVVPLTPVSLPLPGFG